MKRNQLNTKSCIRRALLLVACPVAFTTSPSHAAEPGFARADQSLYATCADKVIAAAKILRIDIPNDPSQLGPISTCIRDAPLVGASCDYQLDRSAIIRRLFEDHEVWNVTCEELNSENPAYMTQGRADVGVRGVDVKVDPDFVRDSDEKTIASVLAHEVMHNMGFRHVDDIGHPLYALSVPEQVESCVWSTGTFNAPPWPNYLDRSLCCIDQPLCLTGLGCYHLESGCVSVTPTGEIDPASPPAASSSLYCGQLFVAENGFILDPVLNGDALMCTTYVDPSGMSHP